ncbi:hypothetical protein GCM10011579_017350 [Streptomyces albiflavescens]|uniref:Uncharacterized protein n=1 Tax=Streptomyces albiflavescens TaxID=1623582 RepID=A0A917XWL7_9ACTN|nr:hypothetical protein GCM10011579_017350 [Streptomyces albiflavescens]
MHGDRVIGHVHGAQQAAVEMPVLGCAQQIDRAQHPVVTASPPTITPMPVVGGTVPVERDADLDAEFLEHIEMTCVELHAIGVNTEIESGDGGDGTSEFRTDVSHADGADEKRFAAVKDH